VLIVYARSDGLSEPVKRLLANVLDADERQRAAHFVHARDRDAFVVAHGVLRLALSRVEPETPSEWRFARTPGGRPIVAGPARGELAFSLTHARSLVACAIARSGTVGIDAEEVAATEPDPLLLAQTCSPAEIETIAARTPALRARAFAVLWTRKEAAAKALDLARNFQPLAFTFGASGTLLANSLITPEAARALTFTTVHADERHAITLASLMLPESPTIARADDDWVTFGLMRRDS
jgi:phosphopantetheinyl transferase